MADRAHAEREQDRTRPRRHGDETRRASVESEAEHAPAIVPVIRRQGAEQEQAEQVARDSGPADDMLTDDRTMEEKTEAVESAAEEVAELLAGLDALDDEVRAMLTEIMDDYELVGLEVADDGTGAWDIEASINPKEKKKTPKGSAPPANKPKQDQTKFTKKSTAARRRKATGAAAQLAAMYGENAIKYKKAQRRKARKALFKRGKLSTAYDEDDEYSDSEDESTAYNKLYGADVRNVTKSWRSKKRPAKKVDNTVSSTKLAAAIAALKPDAHAIHDLIPKDSRSFGATTILTAVVSRKDGGDHRRFVFCNIDGNLPPAMRVKAEALGYHVIAAPQAHAEGQMIQYLKSREGLYNLHNMGCDKEHCAECEWAMNTYLTTFDTTGSFSGKVFKNWYMPPPLIDALGRADASTDKRNKDGVRF